MGLSDGAVTNAALDPENPPAALADSAVNSCGEEPTAIPLNPAGTHAAALMGAALRSIPEAFFLAGAISSPGFAAANAFPADFALPSLAAVATGEPWPDSNGCNLPAIWLAAVARLPTNAPPEIAGSWGSVTVPELGAPAEVSTPDARLDAKLGAKSTEDSKVALVLATLDSTEPVPSVTAGAGWTRLVTMQFSKPPPRATELELSSSADFARGIAFGPSEAPPGPESDMPARARPRVEAKLPSPVEALPASGEASTGAAGALASWMGRAFISSSAARVAAIPPGA
jgi:hypothetical protein